MNEWKANPWLRRALAEVPGVGFVSASHDFTLRLWALSGELLSELLGHTAVVYAVAALPSGVVASGAPAGLRVGGACNALAPSRVCVGGAGLSCFCVFPGGNWAGPPRVWHACLRCRPRCPHA